MQRYLFSYRLNTYNNKEQSYELVPIPGSDISKAVLFAGNDGTPAAMPAPLPARRNTFLYLETNVHINTANRYQNLTFISQMVQLETGLPAEPAELDISSLHTFDEVLTRYGSDEYYSPGVSFGGMVNTPDGITKVAALCQFLANVHEDDANKFKNALQSFTWAKETEQINPHLKYTLFMSLHLSSINQLADNPHPVCPSHLVCQDCGKTLNIKHSTSHSGEMEGLIRRLLTGSSVNTHVRLVKKLYGNLRSDYLHDGLLSGSEREGGFLADTPADNPRHIQLVEDMANVEGLNRILLGLFLQDKALTQ
jgi:hypothetical protein